MGKELTIGVVGAGATGGYLAAKLARAGYPVTLLARGASVEVIRGDGIHVSDEDGEVFVARPARVVAAGEPVDVVDVSLFCVKTYQTEQAAADAAVPL